MHAAGPSAGLPDESTNSATVVALTFTVTAGNIDRIAA